MDYRNGNSSRNHRCTWNDAEPICEAKTEYIEAADVIAASKAVTTLLRCPGIQNGDNEKYELTKEGIQPSHRNVDRAAIAQCMADMIADESMGVNDSLAITNAK